MSARDDLAAIIHRTDDGCQDEACVPTYWPSRTWRFADAIIAAGWRAPVEVANVRAAGGRITHWGPGGGEPWPLAEQHAERLRVTRLGEDHDAELQADAYERGPVAAEPIRSLEGLLQIRRGCDVDGESHIVRGAE